MLNSTQKAANKPTAVATKASAMNGPTVESELEPVWPIAIKAVRITQTVPNKPMNGATAAVVAKKDVYCSSL